MPILARPVPSNISALNPNGFLFSIQKYPELTYFIQESPLPGITLGTAMHYTQVHDIKTPGETMEFDDLTIQFLVDENMDNYIAIYNWITGLGFPENHKQFRDYIKSTRNNQGYPAATAQKTVSDCSLSILNSDNIAQNRFDFVDAFPTSLSGLTYQSTNADVQYLVASLTLAYSYYTVTRVELPGTRNAIFLPLKSATGTAGLNNIGAQPDTVEIAIRGSFARAQIGEFDECSTNSEHVVAVGLTGTGAIGVVP